MSDVSQATKLSLDKFLKTNNLSLYQYQYHALVDFSFNAGMSLWGGAVNKYL